MTGSYDRSLCFVSLEFTASSSSVAGGKALFTKFEWKLFDAHPDEDEILHITWAGPSRPNVFYTAGNAGTIHIWTVRDANEKASLT